MIKLKDLLTEKQVGPSWIDGKWYPAHTTAAMDWIRRGHHIPLTPKTIEKAVGKKIPIKSFHITGPDGLPHVKSILNRKKSISTFTATHEQEKLSKGRGIQTGMGGIILYVEGNLLAQRGMDFDTVPDKQGRRWVSSHYVFDGDKMIWTNAVKRAKLDWNTLEKEMNKIERIYHDRWMNLDYDDPEYLEYEDYKAAVKKDIGPLVAKMIKDYIDLANKTLIKHKKLFKKSLINPKMKQNAWWNEILIYNTKIIDLFVLDRLMRTDNGWRIQSEIEKLTSVASSSTPITIGNPAKYRKWFAERDGKIWKDLK